MKQPLNADLLCVALQGGQGLLRHPQAGRHLRLGQASMFAKGFQQRGKLLGGMDGVVFHGHKTETVSQDYSLYPVFMENTI